MRAAGVKTRRAVVVALFKGPDMKKQKYLAILLTIPVHTIIKSAANPNRFMTRTDVLLHYVALRRLGVKL
jgi:hypothetical protein